jgi:leucyl aminopeptidase (aminopeptidase T)
MPTSKSLTHTKARREASETGTRIATLPGVTAECLIRTMQTDWQRLGTYTRRVAAQLSAAGTITIKTELGTNLTFQTGGRSAQADDGRLNFRGAYGNLPAGEAFLAPLEGTAEGVLVIDGSFPLVGILEEPLFITLAQGRVVEVAGHPCAQELEELLAHYRRPGRNLAEFGVGTLESAKITGNVLEDEKVRGTVHLAIGDNASMGGKVSVPLHLDGVILAPSVWLDGALWMEKGTLIS